jgi:hypothetical protein
MEIDWTSNASANDSWISSLKNMLSCLHSSFFLVMLLELVDQAFVRDDCLFDVDVSRVADFGFQLREPFLYVVELAHPH